MQIFDANFNDRVPEIVYQFSANEKRKIINFNLLGKLHLILFSGSKEEKLKQLL